MVFISKHFANRCRLWSRDSDKVQDKQDSDKESSEGIPVLLSDIEDSDTTCKRGADKRTANNHWDSSSQDNIIMIEENHPNSATAFNPSKCVVSN